MGAPVVSLTVTVMVVVAIPSAATLPVLDDTRELAALTAGPEGVTAAQVVPTRRSSISFVPPCTAEGPVMFTTRRLVALGTPTPALERLFVAAMSVEPAAGSAPPKELELGLIQRVTVSLVVVPSPRK